MALILPYLVDYRVVSIMKPNFNHSLKFKHKKALKLVHEVWFKVELTKESMNFNNLKAEITRVRVFKFLTICS